MYIPLAAKVLFLYISDIYLHLTIAYWTKTDEDKDTLVHTIVPMSSTKEVFMSTVFKLRYERTGKRYQMYIP